MTSSTRLLVILSALVALVVLVQSVVRTAAGLGLTGAFAAGGLGGASVSIGTMVMGVVLAIVGAAVFGLGVFVSLRFVAPITVDDGWRRLILRGVIAAAFGAVAALVWGFVIAVVTSIGVGYHPFGYSTQLGFNGGDIPFRTVDAITSAISTFAARVPLVVLAVVLLRAWLIAHPVVNDAHRVDQVAG